MKLKRLSSEGYEVNECAVRGCHEQSEVVDATTLLAETLVPLCSKHWHQRCDITTEAAEKELVFSA